MKGKMAIMLHAFTFTNLKGGALKRDLAEWAIRRFQKDLVLRKST